MQITVTESVPVYQVAGYRSVAHEIVTSDLPSFFEFYYRQFERCAPIKQGRYQMPEHLREEYKKWKYFNGH